MELLFRKGCVTFYVFGVRRKGERGFQCGEDLRNILHSVVEVKDFLDHTAMLALPNQRMGVDGTKESWFSILGGISRRNGLHPEKVEIGILAFEVETLMSKIVNLWNCLSDIQISRLRKDVVNSPGIVKLVSDDENYLMNLDFAEIVENLCYVTVCEQAGKEMR